MRAPGTLVLPLLVAVSLVSPCRAASSPSPSSPPSPVAASTSPDALPSAARTATPGPRLVLSAGAEARAGDSIEIRWDDVDPSIDELELQLSLDGGRHYTLRASPELDPGDRRYRWRVPSLASGEARLRLRFHRDGHECDGDVSAPFRIVVGERAVVEREQFHEGAWWSGEREVEVPASHTALMPGRGPILSSADAPLPGVTSRDAFESGAPFSPASFQPRTREQKEIPPLRPGAPPRFVPSRN